MFQTVLIAVIAAILAGVGTVYFADAVFPKSEEKLIKEFYDIFSSFTFG